MKTHELIQHLQHMDPEAEVCLFWDGSPRGSIEAIYKCTDSRYPEELGRAVLVGEISIYRPEIASNLVHYMDGDDENAQITEPTQGPKPPIRGFPKGWHFSVDTFRLDCLLSPVAISTEESSSNRPKT